MLSKLAPLVYLLMKHISVVTNASGVRWDKEIEINYYICSIIYKMFYFPGIERLMLSKRVPLMYLWMINIPMVTHAPSGGVKKKDYMF